MEVIYVGLGLYYKEINKPWLNAFDDDVSGY
jgi:hypothetical protein